MSAGEMFLTVLKKQKRHMRRKLKIIDLEDGSGKAT
jgi:hypothetical protein